MKLSEQISCALFATRDTTKEAYDELISMVDTLPKDRRAEVLIAVHILLNTIAKEMNDVK